MCLLLSLDIQNAFNSTSWDHIIEELERKNFSKPLVKIIQSYLSDRSIILDQNHRISPKHKKITTSPRKNRGGDFSRPEKTPKFGNRRMRI